MIGKIRKFAIRVARFILENANSEPRMVTVNIPMTEPSRILSGNAVVTGGTSGIGQAIAVTLLRHGVEKIVITGRNLERLEKARSQIAAKAGVSVNRIVTIALDNSEIDENFNVDETFGMKISILINNAGIGFGSFGYTTVKEFDAIMATNLRGPFFLSAAVARQMIASGIHGNILNIASSSSLRPASSAYTLSKWGIRGLTAGLAKTLIPHGIVVNGLAPGPTATPMLGRSDGNHVAPSIPSGRMASVEEIAHMAVTLVSPYSRMIVGDIIYMTGGAGNLTFDDIHYNF